MADPPSLLTIPTEVQLAICLQLLDSDVRTAQPKPGVGTWQSTVENHAALGSLSLTCKHFQAITAPLLYRRVNVSIRKPAAFIGLIRRFSQFPDYAGFVRELTIGSTRAGSPLSKSQKSFLFREAHHLGIRLLIGGKGLSGQLESILIDVVLCQVSDIRNLTLILPWTTTTDEEQRPVPFDESEVGHYKPFVLTYASRLPASFGLSSLRRLEAYPMHYKKSLTARLHTESLTALLSRTPALTHLVIGRCDQEWPGHGIIQSLLPELRDIHLVDALPKDLAALKRFCPRLERFRLGEDDRSVSDLQAFNMMLDLLEEQPRRSATPSLFKALLPTKNTLHDFDLDCGTYRARKIEDLALLSHFGSLRSLRLVFGHWPAGDNAALINNLSPHLEYLCLGGNRIQVYDIAVLLSGRIRDGRLPKLMRFEYTLLNHPMEYVAGGESMTQKAVSALKEYGVHCVERPYPRLMETYM
ncbi:hypothetical protein B0I37DRAFT_409125 [Chaetomium sp. MPI-CAGE-AT-0009]|nr:hypothetical protein B0I37DRAFT_409125 [Chaetomium sp. MPI-CAGE-AT-0009]